MKRIMAFVMAALLLAAAALAEGVQTECAACGRAVSGDADFRFCPYCGAALTAAEEGTQAVPAGEIYTFANPEIEAEVRERLQKPEGDLTLEELAGVHSVFLQDMNNPDISDLAVLTGLTDLSIWNCDIGDISVLSGLRTSRRSAWTATRFPT